MDILDYWRITWLPTSNSNDRKVRDGKADYSIVRLQLTCVGMRNGYIL